MKKAIATLGTMTHAYQEIYLSKAQAVLGDAFDYAINVCKIDGTDFVRLFVASSVSKRMENGEPAYLAGKSGIEIVCEIVAETKGQDVADANGLYAAKTQCRLTIPTQGKNWKFRAILSIS